MSPLAEQIERFRQLDEFFWRKKKKRKPKGWFDHPSQRKCPKFTKMVFGTCLRTKK